MVDKQEKQMRVNRIDFYNFGDTLVDSVNYPSWNMTEVGAHNVIEHEANKNEDIEYGILFLNDGTHRYHFATGQ
jgi:hypothetical protein